MITEVSAGNRFPSRNARLRAIGLLLLVVTTAGCPRVVSIQYQPSNPLQGHGTVGTAPFRYQAFDERRVRPREVETNPAAKTELFLAQEVGAFFTDALRMELVRSGYTLKDPNELMISGIITRFYLDWSNARERSFGLDAVYTVQSGERTSFTWNCASLQKGPGMLSADGMLIRKGTADCMHRFLEAAQHANVF